ncbi:MAG: COX15/CtaA family protein [Phycisphaerae bacterium]|jgi:cytochrome c oxidase assembly protein subunit 15
MTEVQAARPRAAGDLLTVGFGTTVAMWGIGYVCHLPGLAAPSWAVFLLMIACLVAGGAACGAITSRGPAGAAKAGAITGVLNLLVLGSVLGGSDFRAQAASAAVWVAGSILVTVACFVIGASIARRRQPAADGCAPNWPAAFTTVLAFATLLLLSIGGVVTGYEAGLAVPDWPNTFGMFMFLYPLSKMTGGIYYEHAHRLMGSLVGLSTLVLAVYLHMVEPRAWLRRLALVALAAVILQGILGGLRVTGRFTLSTDSDALAPNLALAVVHGVLGQAFFALVAAMRVFLSQAWRQAPASDAAAVIAYPRALGIVAIVLLLVQLAIGATVRHATWGLHLHLTLALAVVVVTGVHALRAWRLPVESRAVHGLAGWVLAGLGVQLLLGFAALAAVMVVPAGSRPPAWHVLLTTAHQTVGALLLAGQTALALLCWRQSSPIAARRGFPVASA